jgi:uroporphyrinogen-III decarboxylase
VDLLSGSSPEETCEVTRVTIKELGPPGYIVAPDQEMIGEVPLANVEALFRAVREYNLL